MVQQLNSASHPKDLPIPGICRLHVGLVATADSLASISSLQVFLLHFFDLLFNSDHFKVKFKDVLRNNSTPNYFCTYAFGNFLIT